MSVPKCPGQDMRNWKPEDIFYVQCSHCYTEIEFWKDEPARTCSGCKKRILNPRINMGCKEWCTYGKDCSGS